MPPKWKSILQSEAEPWPITSGTELKSVEVPDFALRSDSQTHVLISDIVGYPSHLDIVISCSSQLWQTRFFCQPQGTGLRRSGRRSRSASRCNQSNQSGG